LPNQIEYKDDEDEKTEYIEVTDSFWASPDGEKLITIG
jgi:hypothetical protein